MDSTERKHKIESYGGAYQILTDALKRFPREMWDFRPAKEQWTIGEILVHIADSEANSYVRCRRIIAEPGSTILGYDEARWAQVLHYQEQDGADSLELFRWLRRKSYTLIKTLPDATWSNSVVHSEIGKYTLEDWLDIYERHIPEHVQQMQAVYDAWVEQNRSAVKP